MLFHAEIFQHNKQIATFSLCACSKLLARMLALMAVMQDMMETHKQTNYCKPHCACTLIINYLIQDDKQQTIHCTDDLLSSHIHFHILFQI